MSIIIKILLSSDIRLYLMILYYLLYRKLHEYNREHCWFSGDQAFRLDSNTIVHQ